jgi:hypothetical protein
MHRHVAQSVRVSPRLIATLLARLIATVATLAALAGCGGQPVHHARTQYDPTRYYPPPGSPGDPWGPYIREASGRFGVPEIWIRRVMRQESGGQEDVISWAGAMGLMQVMPDTYDELRGRYNLGSDPFDPHNNILAGTAYLKEMYDRYGSPGFLAAYNAGPNRLDRYLNEGTPLPLETVNYVAAIAPTLGSDRPMSGPLAVYAGGPTVRMAARATTAGCDVDAAYNPDQPCASPRPAVMQAAYKPVYGPGACDPDAAYDPTRPCQPMPAAPPIPAPVVATAPPLVPRAPVYAQSPCDPEAAYDPTRACQRLPPAPVRRFTMADARPLQERMRHPVAFAAGPPPGHWAIQVGAFASLATAEAAAEKARSVLPEVLRTAKIELPATAPFGNQIAFRARLFGLSPSAAVDACSHLSGRGVPCITVPPTGASF